MGSQWGPQSSEQHAAQPSPTSPTPQLIYMHWMNTVVNYCGPFEYEVGYCERLKSFLEANLEWMQEEMESNKDSAYWHQVGAAAMLRGVGRRAGSAVGACPPVRLLLSQLVTHLSPAPLGQPFGVPIISIPPS